MIKIVLIGITGALLAAWVKTVKTEYALWIMLAVGVFMGLSVLSKLEIIVGELRFLQSYFIEHESYVKI